MGKQFAISSDRIRPLANGYGACLATDMITVDGRGVGYAYREDPSFDGDSGWRFFSDHQSQEYVDDRDNTMIYDVNTIANYDQDVIPLLESPVASVLERDRGTRRFVQVIEEP